jgi:hypothetical protein
MLKRQRVRQKMTLQYENKWTPAQLIQIALLLFVGIGGWFELSSRVAASETAIVRIETEFKETAKALAVSNQNLLNFVNTKSDYINSVDIRLSRIEQKVDDLRANGAESR